MTRPQFLLCTDLDRTVLPNGREPESPQARALFTRLVNRPEVILAYVTGRHFALVEEAIADYGLPQPNFVITDVGTKIHTRDGDGWRVWREWQEEIAIDWAGYDHAALRRLFEDLTPLQLQESAKQNTHKLSYYLPVTADRHALEHEIQRRLRARGVRASLVWSVDEPAGIGLLDVLPARATKLHALEFLREHLGLSLEQTMFAGDSGNDLEVMASGVPSVLVANAVQDVRQSAVNRARAAGHERSLYLAHGGYLGMNGNYAAGILEGLVHFKPELARWITPEARS